MGELSPIFVKKNNRYIRVGNRRVRNYIWIGAQKNRGSNFIGVGREEGPRRNLKNETKISSEEICKNRIKK